MELALPPRDKRGHVQSECFRCYAGAEELIRFASVAEVFFASVLDYYEVSWMYEPRTFVLERAEDGRIIEAFTPDFYLPGEDRYIELTAMKQTLVTRKNRKLRKLKEHYPEVKIQLWYQRDLLRFERQHGSTCISSHLGEIAQKTQPKQAPRSPARTE